MSRQIHEFKLDTQHFEELLKSRRRFHVSMARGVDVKHVLRVQERAALGSELLSGRQMFLEVTHKGEVYELQNGKKIQEIWFRVAATENCAVG